jgi:hypothetical protein
MDAYQQAVEYLTANPTEIHCAWYMGNNTLAPPGSVLFKATGHGIYLDRCGCLTQVKAGQFPAYTPRLTRAILADDRIPLHGRAITVDHLPIFAGWQRRLDQVLGRTPPDLRSDMPLPTGDIPIPEIMEEPACRTTLPSESFAAS